MKLKSLLYPMLAATLTALSSGHVKSTDANDPAIDQILIRAGFTGTALVAEQGVILHHQGYGFAVKEWAIENRPSTRFRIASLSKNFTATLIMMLVEEGKINLDKPLKTYLPNYKADYAGTVTVKHLLQHRSGISRQFKIPGWKTGKSVSPISKEQFLTMIAGMPLEFKPDSKRHYSSANYFILGAIIETVTGKDFGTVLKEKILIPLNMKDSDIFRTGQVVPNLARAYKHVNGQYSFCPPVSGDYCIGGAVNFALFHASGSMHATATDLLKWDQALYGSNLLNKESKAFLFSPKTHAVWNVMDISLTEGQTTKIMIADGGLEGYKSIMVRFPNEKRSIILLNNTGISHSHMLQTVQMIALAMFEK